MHDFTLATLGGVAIGASAVIMMGMLGRVTGVSGIFWTGISSAVKHRSAIFSWQILFVLGIIGGALLTQTVLGLPVPPASQNTLGMAVLAGLVVGFGTNLGSGCTSGHGVCGISRLSTRSISATLVFMLFGFVTVFIVRHWLGGAA